jgi:Fe-S protein assembly co-chaperone HscB
MKISRVLYSRSRSKIYGLNSIGQGSRCVSNTDTGFSITTDLPKLSGGSNTGPQPVELLLSALTGCKQATAMFVGRHMKPRMYIDRIEFNLNASRLEHGAIKLPLSVIDSGGGGSDMPPSRLQSVDGTAQVYLTNNKNELSIDFDKKQWLHELERQVEQRCPVANMMIASGCNMNVKWSFGEDSSGVGGVGGVGGGGCSRNVYSQQRRHFSSTRRCRINANTNADFACWYCGKDLKLNGNDQQTQYLMFCPPATESESESASGSGSCPGKVLQPLRSQSTSTSTSKSKSKSTLDYYSLFNLNRYEYNINIMDLEKEYKRLQRQCHPDLYANTKYTTIPKHVNGGGGGGSMISEHDIASDNSSVINQAYQVLKDSVKRASYILNYYYNCNVLSEDSGTHKNINIAMEIFELNERHEELLEMVIDDTSNSDGDGDGDGDKNSHVLIEMGLFLNELLEMKNTIENDFHRILTSLQCKNKNSSSSSSSSNNDNDNDNHNDNDNEDKVVVMELSELAVRLQYVCTLYTKLASDIYNISQQK